LFAGRGFDCSSPVFVLTKTFFAAVSAHSGSVFSLCEWINGVISGGRDGLVKIWCSNDNGLELAVLRQLSVSPSNPWIRAICLIPPDGQEQEESPDLGTLVVGTAENSIFQIQTAPNAPRIPKLVTAGHTGELWGLAIRHGAPQKSQMFATSGMDGILNLWRASHDSAFERCATFQLEAGSHACDFASDGAELAVAQENGSVVFLHVFEGSDSSVTLERITVVSVATLTSPAGKPRASMSPAQLRTARSAGGGMTPPRRAAATVTSRPNTAPVPKTKTIFPPEETRCGIDQIRFSPDGNFLACATHEQCVVILARSSSWGRSAIVRGFTSFVSHLDWSVDGAFLQTNSGDYEYCVWDAATGNQITRSADTRDVEWSEWTLPFGWPCSGIWGDSSDGTDVNAVHRSHGPPGKQFLVTSDDFARVNLFNFPSLGANSSHFRFFGHASHVMNCRVTDDDRRVITTGGMDACTLVWRVEEVDESTGLLADAEGGA
jgi:WD40 repeat protein